MSLVKILNLLLVILIIAVTFDLFFGIDSKKSFFELQEENRFLIEKNKFIFLKFFKLNIKYLIIF